VLLQFPIEDLVGEREGVAIFFAEVGKGREKTRSGSSKSSEGAARKPSPSKGWESTGGGKDLNAVKGRKFFIKAQ